MYAHRYREDGVGIDGASSIVGQTGALVFIRNEKMCCMLVCLDGTACHSMHTYIIHLHFYSLTMCYVIQPDVHWDVCMVCVWPPTTCGMFVLLASSNRQSHLSPFTPPNTSSVCYPGKRRSMVFVYPAVM